MDNFTLISFEPREIQLISDEVYFWIVLFQRITLLFTLFTYSLLIYIVWTNSPRRIGNYKWYIMVNATFGTLFEAITSLFAPYPVLPYPIIVTRGLSDIWIDLIQDPPEWTTKLMLNSGMLCTIFLVYSTTSQFVYRYWQTTQQHEFLRLASNMKLYFLSYVVVGVVCGLLMLFPINLQLLSNNELKESIRQVDPKTFAKMENHISIGFNTRTAPYYLFTGTAAAIMMSACGLTMSYCTFMCYRYLRQNKYMLSSKVARLFKSLINILVIDLFVGFTAAGTLGTFCTLSFMSRSKQGSLAMLLGLSVADLYPFYSHLIVLIYIEPYRHGVFRLLRLERYLRLPKVHNHLDVYSSSVKPIFLNQTRV